MSILREEPSIFGISVDAAARGYLYNTARWAKFIGITYFIVTGLLCLLFPWLVYETPTYGTMPDDMKLFLVMFMVVMTLGINFYPLFALLRFSAKIKPALQTENQQQFNAGLCTLKNLFKYIGIATIVFISLYGILIVIGLASTL